MSERRVSDHVVNTLARAIAEAKAGNIDAVALVSVGSDGRPVVNFGGDGSLMPSIFLGVGMLQATIMEQALSAQGAKQMHSGLIVPGTEH